MSHLKMIVGLGNPGPTYARNRHNVGFQIIDLLARRHGFELNRTLHRARIGDGWMQLRANPDAGLPSQRHKVLLVKPLTFMNGSGEAVAPLARFFQIANDEILVIHDHLDLEKGRLRLRPDGGSGGNNGIKSIIQQLGDDFPRLRVGIGRPPGRMDPAAYVLQDFDAREEEELIGPLRESAADAVEMWLWAGITEAMNRFNG